MDNDAHLSEEIEMQKSRSFICVLLILVMVPWGAFAAPAAIRTSVVPAVEYADYGVDTPYEQSTSVIKASVRKSCRTVIGVSCGPDRVLPGSISIDGHHAVRVTLIYHSDWYREGRQYAPPFDPPRDF